METLVKEQSKNEILATSTEIRTITDLWNATIEYYKEGLYDTDAMYNVYRRSTPRITFQDIANVFSGVYADTYWNVVKMDASILSKHMVQALGLSDNQATLYANNAMRQWRGAFSRNNISDTGSIPSQGAYTQSIDIVCNQDSPLMPAQLIENWNNEFWKTPTVGKNYIYVRVQNKDFVGDLAIKAQMFYTTGGFNQPPSSWIQCLTVDGDKQEGDILLLDNKSGVLNLGDRGASEAFYFNPKSTNHVCVIAAMRDEYFVKNDPLGISGSNWNSTVWITHNGAAVWHNVNPQVNANTELRIFNQDGTNEKFILNAQCRNVPVGYTISFESKDKLINSGEITIKKDSQFVQTEFALPGYYEGDVDVKIEGPNGELLPQNAAVELTMLWKLPKGHDFYTKAAETFDALDLVRNERSVLTSLGSYTITGQENYTLKGQQN